MRKILLPREWTDEQIADFASKYCAPHGADHIKFERAVKAKEILARNLSLGAASRIASCILTAHSTGGQKIANSARLIFRTIWLSQFE